MGLKAVLLSLAAGPVNDVGYQNQRRHTIRVDAAIQQNWQTPLLRAAASLFSPIIVLSSFRYTAQPGSHRRGGLDPLLWYSSVSGHDTDRNMNGTA